MMTKDELRKHVRGIEKEHRDKLEKLRREQDAFREAICLNNGGHFWWAERRIFVEMAFSEYNHYEWIKRCEVCGKRESRREE